MVNDKEVEVWVGLKTMSPFAVGQVDKRSGCVLTRVGLSRYTYSEHTLMKLMETLFTANGDSLNDQYDAGSSSVQHSPLDDSLPL